MRDPSSHFYPTATHWGTYDVEVRDGRLVDIHPFEGDGEPSAIGRSMLAVADSRCRVTQPMVRAGYLERGPTRAGNRRGAEPFVPVSWEMALDMVAAELDRVREVHGNQAIFGGSYGWASAGRFHHAQSQVHRFLNVIGGYTRSVNTYSYAAMEVILPRVIGEEVGDHLVGLPTWEEIAAHTDLVVSFGGLPLRNSQVNPGGVGRHAGKAGQRLCREAGVRFVNVSPVRNDTAGELEAEWISLRPNTDTALMLALAHTMVTEDLHDRDFLERCCVGFDRFRAYLSGESDGCPKDAEWAAAICTVSPDGIRDLARRMARGRTLVTMTWALQRADHGEQPYWMALTLAAIAGQLGRRGGGCGFGYCCGHRPGQIQYRLPTAALPQMVGKPGAPHDEGSVGDPSGMPFIPVARIADMLLQPGEVVDYDGQRLVYPDIRLVYWCGGNPFHHHQDINRLLGAWQRPDTIVVHEPFWNALARHADIVLPCTTTLERNDFSQGRSDGWLVAMHRAIPPQGEARDDYEIFAELADRLGARDRFTEGRSADEWVTHLYEVTVEQAAAAGVELPDFESFWAAGRVGLPAPPGYAERPMQLQRLREDPDANPIRTPSGRLEIVSETIESFGYDDCPAHPTWMEPAEWLGSPLAERHPLHMLSSQPAKRLHSQFDHGVNSVESKIHGREPVYMNVEDAEQRGIADGDVVRIYNDRGAALAGALVTDAIMPGVLQLPTGAWYDPLEPGAVGSLDRHGNPNMLTLDKGTSKLAQGPIAQTTLVEVERYAQDLPPITVFDQPR